MENRRQRAHLEFIARSFQESEVRYFKENSSRIKHIEALFEVKVWQNLIKLPGILTILMVVHCLIEIDSYLEIFKA
jgi:hypothetical protein